MTVTDIKPSELLAALNAFAADRKLTTRGRAIRVLVTNMLMQLGYLRHRSEEKSVYRSSNGDEWFVGTDANDAIVVTHRANPSSGGTETRTPVEEFLKRGDGSPEAQSVWAAITRFPVSRH